MNTKSNFSFKEKARNSVATSSTSTSSMANGNNDGSGGVGSGGGESDSANTGGNLILLKRSSELASSSASSTSAMLASAKAKNYFKTQLKLESSANTKNNSNQTTTDSTYGSATSNSAQETGPGEILKSNSFMTSTGNGHEHLDSKPPALQTGTVTNGTTKKSSFLNVKLTSGSAATTTVKKNSNENLRSSMNRSTQQPKSQIASSSASGIQMRGPTGAAYEKSSSAQIRSSINANGNKKTADEPVVFVSSLSSSSSYNSTTHSSGSGGSTSTNISGLNKATTAGLLAPPSAAAPQQSSSTLLRKEILLIPSDKLDDLISKSINKAMKSNDVDAAAATATSGQIVDQMASFIDELKDFIDDRLIDTTSQLELSNRHMYHLYKSVNYLIKEVSHLKLQNEELKQELFILNSHMTAAAANQPGSPKFKKANFYETIIKRGASNKKERCYVTSDAINNATTASGDTNNVANRSHLSFVNRDHQKSSENSIESTCSTSGTNGTTSTAASHSHSEERQHNTNQTWHKSDTNGNYYENLYKPRNLDWRLISSNKKLTTTTNPSNTTTTTAAGSPTSSATNPILAASPMLNFLTSSEMEINDDLIGGGVGGAGSGTCVGHDDDKYISIEENLDDEKVNKLLLGELDYLKNSFSRDHHRLNHHHHHHLHPTTNTTNNNSNSDNSNLNCNNDSCSNATTNSDEKADDDSSSLHEDDHRRILPLACESSTNTNHSGLNNNNNVGSCSNSQNLSRQEKMLNSNSKVLHHLHTSILPFTNLINDFDAQYSWDYTDNNNI